MQVIEVGKGASVIEIGRESLAVELAGGLEVVEVTRQGPPGKATVFQVKRNLVAKGYCF